MELHDDVKQAKVKRWWTLVLRVPESVPHPLELACCPTTSRDQPPCELQPTMCVAEKATGVASTCPVPLHALLLGDFLEFVSSVVFSG